MDDTLNDTDFTDGVAGKAPGIRERAGRSLRPKTTAFTGATVLMLLGAVAAAGPAAVAPYKDDLFAYGPLTAASDDGDRLDVDYSEKRDIDDRDEIPERRVNGRYVDLSPLDSQKERVVKTPAGPLKIITVGNTSRPGTIVLFIHGRNGDRRLGMSDRTFGGNFNRLKNLMARSGGLYVTADAGTFGKADAGRIAGLVEGLGARHPEAAIVLACASMGGEFCWDLLGGAAFAERVSGIVMLSANNAPPKVERLRRMAGDRRVPLVLVHGTRDKVFAWAGAESLYATLHAAGYPVRFVSLEGGNHGTPIRMIDWRDTLNWLFARMP